MGRANYPPRGGGWRRCGGEGVTGSALVELRRPRRVLYGLLHRRIMRGVEDGPARRRVGARPRGREEGLPGKRRHRVGHLGAQGVREVDFAPTRGELGPVLPLHLVELSSQILTGPRRQKRGAVVIPLAAAHHDLPAFKVHVLHPYREAFEQAEAAAVEDFADEPERGLELARTGRGARRVVKAANGGLHGLDEDRGNAPGRGRANAVGGYQEVSTRAAEELRRWCRFFSMRVPWPERTRHERCQRSRAA